MQWVRLRARIVGREIILLQPPYRVQLVMQPMVCRVTPVPSIACSAFRGGGFSLLRLGLRWCASGATLQTTLDEVGTTPQMAHPVVITTVALSTVKVTISHSWWIGALRVYQARPFHR